MFLAALKPNGEILWWSDADPPPERLTRAVRLEDLAPAEERAALREALESLGSASPWQDLSLSLEDGGGIRRACRLRLAAVLGPDGRVERVQAHLETRDASPSDDGPAGPLGREREGRRIAEDRLECLEERLRKRIQELSALHALDDILNNSGLSVPEKLERAAQALSLGFQRPEGTCVRLVLDGAEYRWGKHPVRPVDLRRELVIGGNRRGLLEALVEDGYPSPSGQPFLEEEQTLIRNAADCVARMVETHEAVQAVQASAANLHTIFDNTGDAIYLVDAEGGLVDANQATQDMLGYSREQLLTMGPRDIYQEEERPEVDRRIRQAMEDGSLIFETKVRRADGSLLDVEVNTRLVDYGGRRLILAAARDISGRKEYEERLRSGRAFAHQVLDSLNANMAVVDGNGIITMVNRAWKEFARQAGLDPERVGPGTDYLSVVAQAMAEGDEQAARAGQGLRRVLDGALKDFSQEYPCPSPERERWYRMHISPLADGGGAVLAHFDITSRVLMERELTRSYSLSRALERIISTSPAVAFMCGSAPGWPVSFITDNVEQFGYSRDDFFEHGMTFADLVHPDDLPDLTAAMAEVNRTGHGSFAQEFRLRTADGRSVWVDQRGLVVRDPNGRATHYHGVILDITDRRRLDEERTLLFRLLPDLLSVIGLDSRFRQVNRAWTDILGWSEDELASRPWTELVHPDDQSGTMIMVRELKRGRAVRTFRNRLRDADGDYHWLSWTAYPLLDQGLILAVARDITEAHLMSEKLKESEERFRRVVETMNEGLVMVDAEQRITFVNQAFLRTLGFGDPGAVLGRAVLEMTKDENRRILEAEMARITKGGTESFGLDLRRDDGEKVPVLISPTPALDAQGNFLGGIAVIADLTRLKRLEAQLLVGQRLEAVGHLAAGIAHEINTPAQLIGNNAEFLRDAAEGMRRYLEGERELAAGAGGGLAERLAGLAQETDLDFLLEEMPGALEGTREAVTRISEIVSSMRSLALSDSDQVRATDLNDLVKQAVTVSRNEWKYVAELTTELDPELPPIYCMPGQINQVLVSLIVNAAQAIDESRQAGSLGRITVRTGREQDEVVIQVSDTGGGIPADLATRVFDPFFTTKEVGVGTGQGLAIAHAAVVERHKGALYFDSRPGQGTTFTVRLPLQGRHTEEATGMDG